MEGEGVCGGGGGGGEVGFRSSLSQKTTSSILSSPELRQGELISTPACTITQDDQPTEDMMSTSPSSVCKVCHLLLSRPANVSLYGHALHSLLNPLIRPPQRHWGTAVLEGHYGVVLVLRCCGCMYYDVRFDLR